MVSTRFDFTRRTACGTLCWSNLPTGNVPCRGARRWPFSWGLSLPLEKHLDGDKRSELAIACLSQSWVREAPVSIVLSAVFERTTKRYGKRGVQYVHMEVGHVAQNVYLQATALKLGTVIVGAFEDERVSRCLGLPQSEVPLAVLPVGVPVSGR